MSKVLGFTVSSGIMLGVLFGAPAHPESAYAKNDQLYVSNLGEKLEPLVKDKDGFLSLYSIKNGIQVQEDRFIEGLDAPKGMEIIGDTLYVTDIDKVKGFDLDSRKQVFELSIKNAVFLNDLARSGNYLFLSDTGTGEIYKINVKTKEYTRFAKLDPKYGGPNGLLVLDNKLFVAGYDPSGKIKGSLGYYSIRSKNPKFTVIGGIKGHLDGLTKDDDGFLIVSDWGDNLDGRIYKVDWKNKKSWVIGEASGMKGIADIFYYKGKIYIPVMVDNNVLTVND